MKCLILDIYNNYIPHLFIYLFVFYVKDESLILLTTRGQV